MTKRKPIIAHITEIFFAQTQTFIYNYLVKCRKTHPICISFTPLENIHLFPFPKADLYSTRYRAFTPAWLVFGVIRRVTGKRLGLEYILRRRKASLIHAHFGTIGYRLIDLKLKLGLPLVTTFYGYDLSPSIIVDGVQDWRERLFAAGDLFLVEGVHMKQRLVELGCPPEKILIQRIAIPVKDIPWRPRRDIAGRPPVVLFSGRFAEKKGLIYALAAIDALKREGRSLEFRIIGDGTCGEQIRRFIEDRAMGSYTHLLGFLNYKDYLSEMDKADIFLHPSVTTADGDTEGGAPTVILEAQAMGLPIVSTYHCDIPNVVAPGKSALLVEERNSPALAGALRYLLDHPAEWETMGRMGRDFVQQFHDVDLEVGKLEEKYYQISPARINS